MKNNEYGYRIMLEFNEPVVGADETDKSAFKVYAKEYEYTNGPTKEVQYEVVRVSSSEPELTEVNSFDCETGVKDNTLFTDKGNIILSPIGGD